MVENGKSFADSAINIATYCNADVSVLETPQQSEI